jgi:ParB-like chromosome segregation protein Spo0J
MFPCHCNFYGAYPFLSADCRNKRDENIILSSRYNEMILNDIEIAGIDADCEEFRISDDLDSESLVNSLRTVGQLNPVVLLERGARPIIVCGFRRIAALRRLGVRAAAARILTDEDCRAAHPLKLALCDNLAHRTMFPLEQARALVKLRDICGVTRDLLISEYLPRLGLSPHENTLAAYLALHEARTELKRLFAVDTLTLASIERLSKLSEDEQERFAAIMTVVRLSASLQKKTLDLLDDLAGINRAAFTAPLDIPEIQEFLQNAKLSSFQKGDKLYDALYRLRNPRVTRAEADFAAKRKRLGLPGAIRVTPPPYFETAELRVEFAAASPEKFRELAAALQKAADSPDLDKLYILNGSVD